METENIYKELEETEKDLKGLRAGKYIDYDVKTRELKRAFKHTLTAKLQVGPKTYKVKQDHFQYKQGVHAVDDDPLNPHRDWFLSTTQMKSILANNDLWINHKSTFDGMTDGTEYLHGGYVKPSKDWLNRIIDQLSSRGLFRCWYNSEDSVFVLYSCVDDYEVYVDGVDFL